MRKNFLAIFVIVLPFLVSSCYQKYLLFEAEAVSMTKRHSGGKAIKVGKEVRAKWCTKEMPIFRNKGAGAENEVGMADQAIYRAQGKGKKADFIVEARIFTDTDGCAIVMGRRAKIR